MAQQSACPKSPDGQHEPKDASIVGQGVVCWHCGCSRDCILQTFKIPTSDDEWHDRDCPNHSISCCGINEDEE